MEEFALCLDQGITPKPDLKEGIHTLAIMEAMEKSIETGNVIKVSDILAAHNISFD
jgi:predicted dehydrogenase